MLHAARRAGRLRDTQKYSPDKEAGGCGICGDFACVIASPSRCVSSRGVQENRRLSPRRTFALIYGSLWFHQYERRDLDIKLLLAIVDHLVSSLHRPEGHGERAA